MKVIEKTSKHFTRRKKFKYFKLSLTHKRKMCIRKYPFNYDLDSGGRATDI